MSASRDKARADCPGSVPPWLTLATRCQRERRQFESGLVLRAERNFTASIDEVDVVVRDDESFRALRGYQRETLHVMTTLPSK
jgi:hypothetical protein